MWALDGVDLSIPRGETHVLLGVSGCGKSTLLRIVLGLVEPDAGCVRFDGARIVPEALLSVRRRMGYVIQAGGLFPHLTARDNASLVARHLGWDAQRIRTRLEELADLVRLPEGLLARYPLELSGGQQQRVGLLRALVLDPEVLLLDEPLGALDPITRAELQDDLRTIFRTWDKTVVLVTHDLAEAAFFADRVVLLRDGRVVQAGRFSELVASPAEPYVERFVRAQRSPLDATP